MFGHTSHFQLLWCEDKRPTSCQIWLLTFWGIPVEMAMCLEILAIDMAPTPHLKCKFLTAHHLTRILHLVLAKIEQAAQPQSFQASVTPAGDIRLVQSKDSGYERTSGCDRDCRVFTHSGGRDWKETSIRSKIWSMTIPQLRLERLLSWWLLPMWQEGQIQILFLHTSWSRGQRLGCRPWPSQIISREGASVIPSRSGWYHPNG